MWEVWERRGERGGIVYKDTLWFHMTGLSGVTLSDCVCAGERVKGAFTLLYPILIYHFLIWILRFSGGQKVSMRRKGGS